LLSVAVTTPVGNERDYIDDAVAQMKSVVKECRSYKVVCLPTFNDFSTDGTSEHLRDLSHQSGFEWIQENKVNNTKSLAQAYIAGYRAALRLKPDFIVEADIGHPYHYLPMIIAQLVNSPIVFGTRYGRTGEFRAPLARKCLSRIGTRVTKLLLGFRMSDGTGGFQGFRREVLEQIPFHKFVSTGHLFQTELKCYCSKLDFVEIEYPYIASRATNGTHCTTTRNPEEMAIPAPPKTRRNPAVTSKPSSNPSHRRVTKGCWS